MWKERDQGSGTEEGMLLGQFIASDNCYWVEMLRLTVLEGQFIASDTGVGWQSIGWEIATLRSR